MMNIVIRKFYPASPNMKWLIRCRYAAPEVMNINDETAPMYTKCMARSQDRLALLTMFCWQDDWWKGVRFVQLFDWGWDSHGSEREPCY